MRYAHHKSRLAIVVAGGAAAAALALPVTTFAEEVDTNLTVTASGTVAISCENPNPVGVEVSPTASSQGVTVPAVNTPSVTVPPVVIGQVQVGPVSEGPFTVGGFTVPSQTLGGETIGGTNAQDEVAGVGALECAAANVSSPSTPTILSGASRLEVWLEEFNTSTSAAVFVKVASTSPQSLTVTPAPAGVDAASNVLTKTVANVPAAGQTDPNTGFVSLGIAQFYMGTPLAVNGVAQPTGLGCESGDFSCSSSATFAVF